MKRFIGLLISLLFFAVLAAPAFAGSVEARLPASTPKLDPAIAVSIAPKGTIQAGPGQIADWFHVMIRDGTGKMVGDEWDKNLVTTVGVNLLLNSTVKGGSQSTTWYVGEIVSSPTFAIGDTMASHSGWTDFTLGTTVTATSRATWSGGTVSAGEVDNSASPASYTQNSTATLYGLYLVDNNGSSSQTTGNLYGEVAFGTSYAVQSGYTVQITAYLTITAG